jgi:hypothetical protein
VIPGALFTLLPNVPLSAKSGHYLRRSKIDNAMFGRDDAEPGNSLFTT